MLYKAIETSSDEYVYNENIMEMKLFSETFMLNQIYELISIIQPPTNSMRELFVIMQEVQEVRLVSALNLFKCIDMSKCH